MSLRNLFFFSRNLNFSVCNWSNCVCVCVQVRWRKISSLQNRVSGTRWRHRRPVDSEPWRSSSPWKLKSNRVLIIWSRLTPAALSRYTKLISRVCSTVSQHVFARLYHKQAERWCYSYCSPHSGTSMAVTPHDPLRITFTLDVTSLEASLAQHLKSISWHFTCQSRNLRWWTLSKLHNESIRLIRFPGSRWAPNCGSWVRLYLSYVLVFHSVALPLNLCCH